MAFIRKHRLLLVPPFAVMCACFGLLLLLPSESEEPGGNVSSAYPRETVKAWQEDVPKRTQHGREYRFVRTVEYVDPETEELVAEEVISTVRERATNACYKDAAGEWQRTVAEWEPGGLGFRMKANSWQIEVPVTLGSAYEYTVGGRTLAMRPSVIGLSDGQQTVVLGQIDTTVIGQIDPNDPSRLVFTDALGANTGVDIELVLKRAALHQNVVLRYKPALPEGFNAAATRLYMYTELGLDALTAGGDVNVRVGDAPVNVSASDLETARNTNDPITFSVKKTVSGQIQQDTLHRFVESRVWDSTGIANETVAARQLWRSPIDSKTYLVESLPHSYIADSTGAVTLDYESQSGTIDEDETWTADATYYVTGEVIIAGGRTLTIEPGTVVKFASGGKITIGSSGNSDAKVVAKGEPHNYIVFTSKNDDNSGEDLTPGQSTTGSGSDYPFALNVDYYASDDSVIEYCKAAYAATALRMGMGIDGGIRHCIVDHCWWGIAVARAASDTACDVHNCLVTNCVDGIIAWLETSDLSATLSNCTCDDDGDGFYVYVASGTPSATFTVRDCLFSNDSGYGIKAEGNTGGLSWTLEKNAFYEIGTYSGVDDPDEGEEENDTIILTGSPYETGVPTGDYYLNETTGAGDKCRKGAGSQTYASAGLDDEAFTYLVPNEVPASIATAEWEPLMETKQSEWPGSNEAVGIGYHHNRIDYLVDNQVCSIASGATLTIEPGVVVAFSGSSALLRFLASATQPPTLTCNGDPDTPIVMAGAPSVSMGISTKRDGHSDGALVRNPVTVVAEVSITYCRFIGLHTALQVSETSTDEILHCAFERNGTGVYCVYAGYPTTFTLKNCVFQNNDTGCYLFYAYGPLKSMTLRDCTFDRADKGVRTGFYISPYNLSLTVKDCLFTNCTTAGVYLSCPPGTFTEDYNAFWNCEENVWDGYTSQALAIGSNSMVLTADPYDPDWFDANDPGSVDWSAQWYLDQEGACIDAGSDNSHVEAIALSASTTSLDGEVDVGKVDIGYHYGGPAGIEESYLLVGGNPVETAFFTSSTTLQIYADFATDGGTWNLYVDETWETSGTGDMNGQELSLSGWDPGWHTIKITYSAAGTADVVFRICIDDSPPSSVAIINPATGATVVGY